MRVRLFLVLALSLPAFAACGGDDEDNPTAKHSGVSPAIVAACDHLQAGDWTALSDASHAPEIREVSPVSDDLPQLPASGTLEDWFNNTGLFGDAYSNSGYQQPRPMGWTDEEMKAEAERTLTTAWSTCAREIDGFPSEPDAKISTEVTNGALNLAP